MNRLFLPVVLLLGLCPIAFAQTAASPQSDSDALQPSAIAERTQAIRSARTIRIHSETVFITASTLERALMNQKNWHQLDLNIVGEETHADLQLDVDRLHFTHIHTYTLTDRSTGIVLAAGRVRALDGVIASDPLAEQIVKILSADRSPTTAAASTGSVR